jgi:hypothetical protein
VYGRTLRFQAVARRAVQARFDGGAASSGARSVAFPFLSAIIEWRFRFSRQSPTFELSESGTDARFPSEVRHFVWLRHPSFGHGVVSIASDPLMPGQAVEAHAWLRRLVELHRRQ